MRTPTLSVFLALCALCTAANAKLVYDGVGAPSFSTVQAFGTGSHTFNLRLLCPPSSTLVSATLKGIDEKIATRVKISPTRTKFGYNLTTLIETDGALGYTSFTVLAKTSEKGKLTMRTLPAALDVLGVQFSRDGAPLGGDGGPALEFPSYAAAAAPAGMSFAAKVYAGRGRRASLKDCAVRVRETGLRAPMFLRKQDVLLSGDKITVHPRGLRATRGCALSLECSAVEHEGETAENEVRVGVKPEAPLPPVVVSDEISPKFVYNARKAAEICPTLLNYDFIRPDKLTLAVGSGSSMFLCDFKSVSKVSGAHRACFSVPKDADVKDGPYRMKVGVVKDGAQRWAYMRKPLKLVVKGMGRSRGRRFGGRSRADKWRYLPYRRTMVYSKIRGSMLKPMGTSRHIRSRK